MHCPHRSAGEVFTGAALLVVLPHRRLLGINWGRLFQITGDARYRDATRILGFVKKTQLLRIAADLRTVVDPRIAVDQRTAVDHRTAIDQRIAADLRT